MRMFKSIYSHTLVSCILLATPALAYGQFISPLSVTTLQELLILILNAVIFILFPIIVLMVVYTGFLFVVAQGNEQKISEARKALIYTVIGALVVLGSKALALAICATVQSIGASVVCPT